MQQQDGASYKTQIAAQSCTQWLGTKPNSSDLKVSVRNLGTVTYTEFAARYVLRNSKGEILQKAPFLTGRLPAGGDTLVEIRSGDIPCSEISKLEIQEIATATAIAGDTISAKLAEIILAAAEVKFDSGSWQTQAVSPANDWELDKEYAVTPLGNCVGGEMRICMTAQDYERACKGARGISKAATKMLAVMASNDERRLLEGGTLDSAEVSWNAAKQVCVADLTVSGIVDGNSTRREIVGVAQTFKVGPEGNLLVTYIYR